MGRINILQPNVFNMLAAGEVVERPSSVVKELVENAIDAGATKIDITIEDGGKRKIQVSDNGIGIAKDDLRSAFLPHATSKILNIDDLDRLATLGFRGEALASISSISEVTLSTHFKDDNYSSMISLSGGNITFEGPGSRAEGTMISVENLFFNTPARLKFLKKAAVEQNYIKDIVKLLILSNPDISISLSNENGVLMSNKTGSLLDAIYSIYGAMDADSLLEIKDKPNSKIKISGYTSKVDHTKPNKTYQTIIVNGRAIQDANIQAVVQNAYAQYLMTRTFPMFVLDIVVPFDEIDVNVHPSKTEVRFVDKQGVSGAIYHAIQDTIAENVASNVFSFDLEQKPTEIIENKPVYDEIKPVKEEIKQEPIDFNNIFYRSIPQSQPTKTYEKEVESKPIDLEPTVEFFDGKIIGQVFATYIIVEKQDLVYIIDQHAAHERILYDKIVKRFKPEFKQPLLIPYELKLSGSEYEYFDKIVDDLISFGFEIEKNNDNFLITSVPEPVTNVKLDVFFADIFKKSLDFKEISLANLLKDKLCQTACKAAIKGGESLSREQIANVLKNYINENGDLPSQCPHGRPCIVALSKTDFEKMFKRIV